MIFQKSIFSQPQWRGKAPLAPVATALHFQATKLFHRHGCRARGPWPLWIFTHSLLTIQISKILSFLVVNTGSILLAPPRPLKKISADALALRNKDLYLLFYP